MKARKLKTWLLGTAALAGVVLTSCAKEQRSEKEEQGPAKQEQKYDIEEARKQYQRNCADSIRIANGYNEIWAKYCQLGDSLSSVRDKQEALRREHSLGYAMEKAVAKSGNKILDKMLKDIEVLLAKYKINFINYFGGEDDDYWNFRTDTAYNNLDGIDYVYKRGMLYVGAGAQSDDEQDEYAEDEFKSLALIVEQIVNESSYGQGRKGEIMSQVKSLIEQTKRQLIASRKSVEKQYADYYVTMAGEDIAIEQAGEGSYYYGYGDLNHDRSVLVRHRDISVYDSQLPVSFFGDTSAEYTLISLGNNKWQVQKKTVSGKVEKTAVFTDAGGIYEWFGTYGKDYCVDNSFYYEPGKNMGVRVEFHESNIIKRASKEWVVPQSVENQIQALEEQEFELGAQAHEAWEESHQISLQADSVANVMALQKFKSR